MARFEMEQELHRGMSWDDIMDDEEVREPGRAVQMHEKLSSPSRKRCVAVTCKCPASSAFENGNLPS